MNHGAKQKAITVLEEIIENLCDVGSDKDHLGCKTHKPYKRETDS